MKIEYVRTPDLIRYGVALPGYTEIRTHYGSGSECLLRYKREGYCPSAYTFRSYMSDGLSIPRCMRWLMGSPWQKGWQAGVWHDYLREFACKDGRCSVREADVVFHRLLHHYGVGRVKARALWLGVKIGNAWETVTGRSAV